jgi:hypothetical protein
VTLSCSLSQLDLESGKILQTLPRVRHHKNLYVADCAALCQCGRPAGVLRGLLEPGQRIDLYRQYTQCPRAKESLKMDFSHEDHADGKLNVILWPA